MIKHGNILSEAIAMCRGSDSGEYFMKIYPFTTENIGGYINHFDLEGKSLLTVGSSADQAINAASSGARDITVLDINPFVRYYYYLKVAALKTLSLKEYCSFLFYYYPDSDHNEKIYFEPLFEKIRPVLKRIDLPSYKFWNTIFSSTHRFTVRRQMFQPDQYDKNIIVNCNPYLSAEGYLKARDAVSKVHVKFVNQNAITARLKGKYDNIWLSNLYKWIGFEKTDMMFASMQELLAANGSMLLAYIYGPYFADKSLSGSHLNLLKKRYKKYHLEEIDFDGINCFRDFAPDSPDSALIFRKP